MRRSRRNGQAELAGWPLGTEPAGAAVFAHNERVLDAPAEAIWPWLLDAEAWPSWYPNARDVHVDSARSVLEADATFRWITFGVRLRSQVVDCDPPRRLGWLWWRPGLYGYHGWELQSHPDGTTRVITEETQRGSAAVRLAVPLRCALLVAHELWLRRLGARARIGREPRP